MVYYSAIKKNEILSFAEKCVKLEKVILTKISQTEKDKYHIFSHVWNLDLMHWYIILYYVKSYYIIIISYHILNMNTKGGVFGEDQQEGGEGNKRVMVVRKAGSTLYMCMKTA
jgi:hypothetical protein